MYLFSQSRRVEVPKTPALGYCEAWMWVSGEEKEDVRLIWGKV